MALCERCGSIRVEVVSAKTILDRLVVLVSGKRPFLCRRCGWRALRDWKDDDLRTLEGYGSGASPDPELVLLDHPPSEHRRPNRPSPAETVPSSESTFDLSMLDEHAGNAHEGSQAPTGVEPSSRRRPATRLRRRSRRPRRREIVVAAVMTGVVIFAILIAGMAGSCVTSPPEL